MCQSWVVSEGQAPLYAGVRQAGEPQSRMWFGSQHVLQLGGLGQSPLRVGGVRDHRQLPSDHSSDLEIMRRLGNEHVSSRALAFSLPYVEAHRLELG